MKEILEILYYFSGIGLFATVGIGIYQIRLFKQEIQILKEQTIKQHERASVAKSIEFMSLFASDLLPSYDEFASRKLKMIRAYNEKQRGKKFQIPSVEINKEFKADTETIEDNIFYISLLQHAGGVDLLNQLEYFSVAMVSGLADQELAFKPLSSAFCEIVEENYLLIWVLLS